MAFRIFLGIPIVIILTLLTGGGSAWSDDVRPRPPGELLVAHSAPSAGAYASSAPLALPPTAERDVAREGTDRNRVNAGSVAAGSVFLPTVLMLLFRRKYPRWWFNWALELTRFGNRVAAYLLLLRDEYPSTDEEQAVHTEVVYPDAAQLNRWLPLVKWFLAIPHYIVLALLAVGVIFVTLFAWFAILITGRYPRGLFEYTVGVGRWGLRVSAYAFLLVTDRYPPFSMQ